MKKIQGESKQRQVIGYLCSAGLVLALAACQKQPEPVAQQAKPVEVATAQGEYPVFQSKIEDVALNIPSCEGQLCPQITIQHITSNYPEIDQVVDHYILNYVKNLVQGFDVDSGTDTQNNSKTNKPSPIIALNQQQDQQLAENRHADHAQNSAADQRSELQAQLDKFLKLSDEVKSLGSSSQLVLYLKPQVLNPHQQIVTVVMNASNYIGGAHGSSAQQYFNFELKSKTLLNLDQLIANGQRKAFNDLAYAAFEQWIKETQPDMDLKTYQKLWKFNLSENFYLSPNGLILQYGEYEIGPYAVGLPRLIIPYDKLQTILKPEYLPVVLKKPQSSVGNSHHPQAQPVSSAVKS